MWEFDGRALKLRFETSQFKKAAFCPESSTLALALGNPWTERTGSITDHPSSREVLLVDLRGTGLPKEHRLPFSFNDLSFGPREELFLIDGPTVHRYRLEGNRLTQGRTTHLPGRFKQVKVLSDRSLAIAVTYDDRSIVAAFALE